MVRDEADIIGSTLRHMLTQVDHAIIADNRSTDDTRAILESFDHVTIIDDPEVGYFQADKMTRLAHWAGEMGAEWVVPFDADEAWYLPNLESFTADVVLARPYVYVPQASDPDTDDALVRFQWRHPFHEKMPKVCFRYHPQAALHMGQHDVDRPGHRVNGAYVRHYQYRSLEQVRRKVTNGVEAYDATGLGHLHGTHWRELYENDDLEAWWQEYVSQPLVFDP